MNLIKLAKLLADSANKQPGKPHLAFVKSASDEAAEKLACEIASRMSARPEIFMADRGLREPGPLPWTSMRTKPLLGLKHDGTKCTMNGRLVVPQDRPIVLLVPDFGKLTLNDQLAYSHMADGEGQHFSLHPGSVLIAAYKPGSKLDLSARSRGTGWELDSGE
jgi:hypothetical protein